MENQVNMTDEQLLKKLRNIDKEGRFDVQLTLPSYIIKLMVWFDKFDETINVTNLEYSSAPDMFPNNEEGFKKLINYLKR